MGSHVAAPALTPNLRYDSTKEFEPIGRISNAPVAVVARKDFPAKDLKEFIAYVKEHGDGEASPWRYRFGVAHGLPAVHLAARS